MSKKRRRDKMEEPTPVWKIVTEHPDIFNTHVMTKLNGNDVKFFYDVNPESRAAIKRSGARLPDAFKIGDFDTTSTISWALEKCFEKKERFCAQMALNGNFGLLQFLRGELCPWNKETCESAASPRVFEIRAQKRMSLGQRYLFKCCLEWSPRVFAICTRKQMSLE